MLYVDVLAGILMIGAGCVLYWYMRPIDGKVNPRLKPSLESYVAVAVVGLTAFGLITVLASIFA